MSVQTPPSEPRSAPSQFDQYVEQQLESTRQQVKLTELSSGLLTLGLWTLGFLLVGILIDSWLIQFGTAARIASFLLLAAGALWIAWSQVLVLFVRRIHRLYAARMIEESSDNFHNSLVNYLQVKEDGPVGKDAVIHAISQRAARDLSRISATEKVDRSRAIKLGFGFVGLVAALVAYTLLSPKSPWPSIARILNPVSSISAPSIAEVTKVSPGNTDVFFGQKLLVTAEIRGRHDPDEVKLVYSTGDGQHVEVPVAMLRSGTTNSYQLELSTTPTGIDGPLTYYVTANDGRSETYAVSVKPNPAITVDKIEVISPSYTRLPPRTLTGQVEIEGIEGSQVKLTAAANMPIQVAWVELLRQKTRGRETTYDVVRTIELRNLAPSSEGATNAAGEQRHAAAGEFTLSLDANRTGQLYSHYQVLFRTVEGQRNQLVNVQPLRVTPDLPPEVKIVRPFDREVSVPLNRSLEIELQAEDPDFEISRLELLLDHQGGRLLDEQVELSENRKQQRLTGNYRFDPRKLKLSVGDVVIFHARASDNRVAALSGQSEPNVARTENYALKIAEPLETEIAESQQDNESKPSESGNQADQSAQAKNQAEKSDAAEKQNSQQAANQPEKNSESKSGENPPGQAESAMNEANPGQSQEDPSKPSQTAQQQPESGEPSSAQNQQPKNDNQSSASQEKPDQKQAEQQEKSESTGEKEQKDEPSGDAQSGSQSKQSSGGAGGQKTQQSSGNQSSKSDQPQDGNQGEQSGEAQARPEAAEKQMGKQGSDSNAGKQSSSKSDKGNEPSGKNQEDQSANQENAQQQSAGRNSDEQNAGSGKQSSSNQSGSQPAGGEKTDGKQQGSGNEAQAGQSQPGQSQPDDQANNSGSGQRQGEPDSNKPTGGNPSGGEPNEKQTGEDNSGQSEPGDSMGKESSNPSEPLDRSASDAERFQRLQERMKRQEQSQQDAQSQDNSAQGNSAESGQDKQAQADGDKSSGKQASGEKNSQEGEKENSSSSDPSSGKQPDGEKSSGSGQPSKKDGEQSKSDGKRNNSGKQSEGEQQTNRAQAEGEKGTGEPSSKPNSGDQNDKQGSGEESSGEQGSEKSDSGKSGNKQSGSEGESQKQESEKGSSGQGGQPSSESGESGKSGQSSEQSGKQSGNDSPKGDNESESGSGKSGQGSSSKQGGEQSGKSGSGGQSGGGESSGASGSSGNAAGSDNAQGSNQEISKRSDQPKGQRSPGGQTNTSSAGAGSNEAPSTNYEDTPGDPEGNLKYSEKATDLVLENLRNQANNPDPELLKEMNWTEQDLKDFIARWEAMKQKAGSGTPQERKRYEDAIRSLGLRPESVRRNVIQSRRDQLNKLSEDGAVNRPPANLANEFNSFLKNRNRVQKDK